MAKPRFTVGTERRSEGFCASIHIPVSDEYQGRTIAFPELTPKELRKLARKLKRVSRVLDAINPATSFPAPDVRR